MTVLQIDATATDQEGNVVTASIEVEVTDSEAPPSSPVNVVPPTHVTGPPPAAAPQEGAPAAPGAAVPGEARQMAGEHGEHGEMKLGASLPGLPQITGLTNATGHNSAVPTSTTPKVTQAVRSTTLFKNTGGYR